MDKKRLLSAMIATTMLIGTIPTYAFAADEEELPEQTVQETAETVDEPLAEDVILPESEDTTPEDEPAAPVEETDQATETPEETTEPEATEPEVTEPEVTEPEVTEEAPAEPEEEPVPETEEAVEVQAEEASLITSLSFDDTDGQSYPVEVEGAASYVRIPKDKVVDFGTLTMETSEVVSFVESAAVPSDSSVMYVSEGGENSAEVTLKLLGLATATIDMTRSGTTWTGAGNLDLGALDGMTIGSLANQLAGETITISAGMMQTADGSKTSKEAAMGIGQDAEYVYFIVYETDEAQQLYDITYDCGDQAYTLTVPAGTQLINAAALSQNGYTFDGWYTDAACSSAADFTDTVNDDITLYAKYTPNEGANTTFDQAFAQQAGILPITTVADFESFVAKADDITSAQRVELQGNVDLDGKTYAAISGFKGDFDGGGYEISNATFTAVGENAGMFATIGADQIVANLTLRDITARSATYSGALAGSISGTEGHSATIQNVQIRDCAVNGRSAGGLAGFIIWGDINYCSNRDSRVTGVINGGGLAGISYGQFYDCYSVGTATALLYKGGIAGKNLEGGHVMHCWCTMSKATGQTDSTSVDDENFTGVSEYTMSFEFDPEYFSEEVWELADGTDTDFITNEVKYDEF